MVCHNMPELGSGFLITCSIQPIQTKFWYIRSYIDVNASIFVVVMVDVVVEVLLTGGGVGVRGQN